MCCWCTCFGVTLMFPVGGFVDVVCLLTVLCGVEWCCFVDGGGVVV